MKNQFHLKLIKYGMSILRHFTVTYNNFPRSISYANCIWFQNNVQTCCEFMTSTHFDIIAFMHDEDELSHPMLSNRSRKCLNYIVIL